MIELKKQLLFEERATNYTMEHGGHDDWQLFNQQSIP